MRRTVLAAGLCLAFGAGLTPHAGASVAAVPVPPNLKVSTRDPSVPSQDFRSPVIAVNPTNSANLVMASRTDEPDYFCGIRYSFDRGATWTNASGSGAIFPDPPLPAGSPASKTSGTCWSPGVAFDGSGNVYVVAQDRPNGGGSPQTVIIWKSTNGGQKFGAPLTIPPSTSSGFSVQADVAIDTNTASPHFNRIYVTWHESVNFGNLSATLTYSDNGLTWSSPTTKRVIPQQSQTIPDLTVAPDGTVYDIFKVAGGSSGSDCAGIGFGSIPASGTDCPVAVLRSSNGGVSFDPDAFIVGTTFFPGGAANATVNTAVAEEPSIVVTPKGTVLVAVATVPKPPAAGCAASLQAVVYRSTDRGQTWIGPKPLNDDSCASGNEHRDPRLSVAPNGRIDVAFYDDRLDPTSHAVADPTRGLLYDVEYANSTDDGLTFGPNLRVTDASFDGTKLFAVRPAGSPPNAFQTRDYDTVVGLASFDDGAVAAWGDTRGGGAADLFTGRVSIPAPMPTPSPYVLPTPTPTAYVIPTPTPTSTSTPTVRKRPGLAATVRPKRDRRRPFRFTTRGKLTLPSGVSKAPGCNGKVRITVKRKGSRKARSSRLATVRNTCAFSSRASFKNSRRLGARRGTLRFTIRFQGNTRLTARTVTRTAKYG